MDADNFDADLDPEPNVDRLLGHVKLCHRIIASLVDIIDALWQHIDEPEVKLGPDADRLERLMDTIRRATDPNKEH